MAQQKSWGYADTPIAGVTALTFPRGLLNFESDWRVKSNQGGKEVVLTNITAPLDRPEKIRIAHTEVANIFAGTGIKPSVLIPTTKGVSILAQVTSVLSVTDDTDPTYRTDDPVSAHLVIKAGSSGNVTASDIQVVVGRLLSSIFDSGSTELSRLEAILRGSLVPKEL